MIRARLVKLKHTRIPSVVLPSILGIPVQFGTKNIRLKSTYVPHLTSTPDNSFGHVVKGFRNPDGSFIQGNTSEEARLHERTLKGRMNHNVVQLPPDIAKAINNNILRLSTPGRLRTKAAQIYQSLQKEQMQTAPTSGLEADAHIAALFLQDYAHCFQVLKELDKRVDLKPESVLSVGYGPATGIVALNEVLGDWKPKVKDAYIVGRFNKEMKKRAKIILSRQSIEYEVKEGESVKETKEGLKTEVETDSLKMSEEELSEESTEQLSEESTEESKETEPETEPEYVGPVDTSRINIQTQLHDTLPSKSYDLIIVNHALLTKEHHFPRDIDINIHMLLKLLKPNGHIVLVERGNALGFETIARARQLMIRPESYDKETGKIPRPYIKGSSVKPQKIRKVDQIITKENVEAEEQMLAELDALDRLEAGEISDFEKDIITKHGEVSDEELRFEFEDDIDVIEDSREGESFREGSKEGESSKEIKEGESSSTEEVNYHLKILAPCSHHSKCPLQLGDPKYYKISSHKHRLNFCSFDKIVERPKFTMELKKGKKLATAWDKSAEDGMGIDNLSKTIKKQLQGSGRAGGNNTENGSFSYLIAQRAKNDPSSIQKIQHEREFNSSGTIDNEDINNWPRIMNIPTRIKNNVKLNVCSPSGNIETWQIPKSLGKSEYHDARKVDQGDLWGLDKKSVITRNQLTDKVKGKLDTLAKTQRKSFIKEQRKKTWKKLVSNEPKDFENDIVKLSDSIVESLEGTKQYRIKGKVKM